MHVLMSEVPTPLSDRQIDYADALSRIE